MSGAARERARRTRGQTGRARARGRLLFVALFALEACNNQGTTVRPFTFPRPEHLAFACIAPRPAPRSDESVVLPRHCCTAHDPSADSDPPALPAECTGVPTDDPALPEPLASPRLHALLSQSTRGEVAAIDLVSERVLDSDRQVPGYTFIDSGGLPSAVVVPPHRPLGPAGEGPPFTYVASAEEFQVRAIPTCRFRARQSCGPDRSDRNLADPAGYVQRTRLALPAAPGDMVLGPDQALWVSLPERGLLARVALSPDPDQAFALDAETEQPSQPQFYRVPAAPDAEPPAPIAEPEEYVSTCGLDRPFAEAELALPIAPRSAPTAEVRPRRLRFDESSGLLWVSDEVAPVLHVFRLGTDGSLTALSALATGAPVRDFVLTPFLPPLAPDLLTRPAAPLDPAGDSKRYLYAIDDRDGTLMVFDLARDEASGAPRLTPLLAPAPGQRFADRIDVQLPSAALEVIDTRTSSDYACGETPVEELRTRRDALEGAAAASDAELNRLEARIDIYDNAAPRYMRGVFVAVISERGYVQIVDLQDLDLACRAQKECCSSEESCGTPEDLVLPRNPDDQAALAVRRHSLRRASVGGLEAVDNSPSQLTAMRECPEGYGAILAEGESPLVCAPNDPWRTLNETWSVQHQAPLPGLRLGSGAFVDAVDPTQLVLLGPLGVDLCARGVELGDLVAILTNPASGLRDCPEPLDDVPHLLTVLEAYRDRLVLQPTSELERELRVAELRRCYPDFVGFEVRAQSFLVTGAVGGTYLHRMIASDEGACVPDPERDEHLSARLNAQGAFQNPFVAFTMAPVTAGEEPSTHDTAVQVRRASSAMFVNIVAGQENISPDALPASLRFLPEVGDLFVVDSASQGLQRYPLRPFEDPTRYAADN